MSLEEKTERAIALLRQYEQEALSLDQGRGFYLADSGGKDSCVILHLAQRSLVKFQSHYHVTTIDPPELVQFTRHYHPETIFDRPDKPFFVRLAEKGLPTRLVRWCCEHYKHRHTDSTKITILGVRKAESSARAGRYEERTTSPIGELLNPIVHWTERDVWDYIHANNVPYCRLYDEGFKRIGCIGCPMAGAMRKVEFARWPKYEVLWRKYWAKYWAKYKGVPTEKGRPRYLERFKSADEMFEWWLSDHPTPDDGTCQQGLW